jgi:hypothetical protein
MVSSRILTVLGLSALVALAATPTPATADVACGATLTTDVTLGATDSVVNRVCNGNGLVLAASDITLDCAGLTIRGAARGRGISIKSGAEGITIQNCSIEGFGTGVLLSGGGFHWMERTVVSGAKDAGIDVAADESIVITSAVQNSERGFIVRSTFSEVSDSVALGNKKEGFSLKGKSLFVIRNVSINNGAEGFTGAISGESELSENIAAGNRGAGFSVSGGSVSLPNFVADNRAFGNTGNGLVATGDDGGGNLALGNGGRIACQISGQPCSD